MSMEIVIVVAFILLLGALYYFIDREIYFYEGMRLGPRLQRWLYDRWAADYDKGKQASQAEDETMLARPILERLADIPEPFLLDLATGTGRLGSVLFRQAGFKGRIIAMDISPKMLDLAAQKLAAHRERVDLVQYLTLPLPFPDESFDAVCCLEALEVMPEMESPLAELWRVLRPGGLLVTSRGTEASGRKDKIRSNADFSSLLEHSGFERVQISAWWKYFDRALAQKPGSAPPAAQHELFGLLRCKACGKTDWQIHPNEAHCRACGAKYARRENNVLVFEIQGES